MTQKRSKSSTDHVSRGAESHKRILDQAIKMASAEGLEALTIGRMATKLKMSKSGLFAHFGSKQKLQLATIEQANGIFDQEVIAPAQETAKGVARLWTLCDLWIGHLEGRLFPSGYFFTGAFFEYGDRNGPLASRLGAVTKAWLQSLKQSVQQAQHIGELKSEPESAEMALELNTILVGAYWAHLAELGDPYSAARIAIVSRLRNWATEKIPSRAFESVRAWKSYLRARAK